MFSNFKTRIKQFLSISVMVLPLIFIGFGLMSSMDIYAQGLDGLRVIDIGGDGKSDTIVDLLQLVQNFLFGLAPTLAVLVITFGGFKYFQGGIDNQTTGRKAIEAGIIGLAVVLLANAIGGTGGFVQQIFGNNGVNVGPLVKLLENTISILLGLASLVSVLVIMYGGYKYFQGGIDGTTDGLNTIKNGVIGLAVVLLATAIRDLVSATATIASNDITQLPAQIQKQIEPLLLNVTNVFYALAVTVTILVIVYGGYQYFFGGFDGKSEGRANIEKGVIGLVVVLLARFIADTVNGLLKPVQTSADFANIPKLAQDIIGPILLNSTNFLLALSGLISVLVIVYGGYQFFISNIPQQNANGKDTITKGVVGLVVVIIAGPIVELIKVTLSVTDPLSPPNTLTLSTNGIVELIKTILNTLLIPISSIVTVFFLVLGAYYYITSGGNGEQVKKGEEAIKNSVIGFIVVLLSSTVVAAIIYFVK